MLVAEKIESAAAYAVPKYAAALRELLGDLQRVERDERFEHKGRGCEGGARGGPSVEL
jgi:hypothetical protein